jgi:hypothetical protein
MYLGTTRRSPQQAAHLPQTPPVEDAVGLHESRRALQAGPQALHGAANVSPAPTRQRVHQAILLGSAEHVFMSSISCLQVV